MASYIALIRTTLLLSLREKSVMFFNYVFPLIFLLGFGQFMGARGAAMTRLVSMVLVIGILGSGLFGAGIRTVVERELGILRRYKVTPISPIPILVASIITGWMLYLPSAVIIVVISHYVYAMPWPTHPLSLLAVVTLGAFAFRAIGLIIASVANSVPESNIMVQLLYLPMLFLSGTTIPISSMPAPAQIVAQFLPASYLSSGIQQVMLEGAGVASRYDAILALMASTVIATFISMKLFRWEKGERLPRSAKAWVAAVFVPFLLLGGWQAYTRDHIVASKKLDREIRRRQTRLIRGAQIITGDGKLIPNGAVLIREGKIARIFEGDVPDPAKLDADPVEAAGKTVIPGLVDAHVHLGAPGGWMEPKEPARGVESPMVRELAAYLYSGVVAVRSAGDLTSYVLDARRVVDSGERLGAELLVVGPLFTTAKGYGTDHFRGVPETMRKVLEGEFLRMPSTPDQARRQVEELKALGVSAVKAALDSGSPGQLFERMDLNVLKALGDAARANSLPLVVHTADARDVLDALDAGAAAVEHGGTREELPPATWDRMKRQGVYYDPALSALEALIQVRDRNPALLARSLIRQVAPADFLSKTQAMVTAENAPWRSGLDADTRSLDTAMANLAAAAKAGVPLAAGTDSGNLLLVHGPALHRELQLWVKAGVSPADAIRAATHGSATSLGIGNRVGLIREGYEASLLIVDGNPLEDIAATERISTVFFKGEVVSRTDLFDQK